MKHLQAAANHIAQAEKAREKANYRADVMRELFAALPDSVETPTLANESEKGDFGPVAWLSFRGQGNGADVLAALESAGFVPVECSRVKWDNYSRVIEPVTCEALPDVKGRYKLTDCAPSAPVWAEWSHGYGSFPDAWEWSAWYRAPSGRLVRVNVRATGAHVRPTAHMERGKFGREDRLTNPRLSSAAWSAVEIAGYAPVALSAGCGAYISSFAEGWRALSAVAHFEANDEGAMAPPSAIVRALMGAR